MNKLSWILLITLFSSLLNVVNSQQFVGTGTIEYEVRTNNHKVMGDDSWAEMFKDKTPQFSTKWYQLTFNNNEAVYKFNRKDDTKGVPWQSNDDEENIWYSDYNNGFFTDYKLVFSDYYLMHDSLLKMEWKLSPNETRIIAGFTCRKATAVLFDSVYVFAFYTDEITAPGGPMGLHGLPGMILGVTIPRMFTSWIATKLEINGVNTSVIKPPTKGKKKTANELYETSKKATSDWGNWGQQSIWKIFL